MKVVSIWNPKGGQGKSMIAINLAAAAFDIGLKPLVIDTDLQGTSLLFHQAGNLPFEVVSNIPSEAPDAELVVIDHQAHDWEIPASPLLVMPVKPARTQYATYADALKKAQAIGKRIITVVTDGDVRRHSQKNTVTALKQRGAFEIRSSAVFDNAEAEYRTIFDPKLNHGYRINDSRAEVSAILSAVLQNQQHQDLEEQNHVAA